MADTMATSRVGHRIQDLRSHSARPSDRKSRSPSSTVASAAILAIAKLHARITDAPDLTSVRAGRTSVRRAPPQAICSHYGCQPVNPASLQMPHRPAR
jgi:hypothetical protein